MDVDKFLVKAEQALRKRHADQAIALYRQVLVAEPGRADARAGLLGAFRRKAELKGGPSLLDKAAAKSLRAACAGLRGDALIRACETALEKNPTDGGVAALLAGALESADRPEEALATWEFRLDLDARDAGALKAAGKLHYRLRRVAEAIDCLDRAHAVDPRDPEVEKLRKHLVAEGTLAATNYEKAKGSRDVRKVKQGPDAAAPRAPAEATAGDTDALSAQLAEDPGDVAVRTRLVRALLQSGDLDRALNIVEGAPEATDEITELRYDVSLARHDAALAEARTGGDPSAVERLEAERTRMELEELSRRVERHPADAARRLELGWACYRAKETERAIEAFQAVASDPRVELNARRGLGACFFRKGLFPLAHRQFVRALELAGGVGSDRGKEICYHLGLVCERLDDPHGALGRYMEIYEVDIHYKDVAGKIEELSS